MCERVFRCGVWNWKNEMVYSRTGTHRFSSAFVIYQSSCRLHRWPAIQPRFPPRDPPRPRSERMVRCQYTIQPRFPPRDPPRPNSLRSVHVLNGKYHGPIKLYIGHYIHPRRGWSPLELFPLPSVIGLSRFLRIWEWAAHSLKCNSHTTCSLINKQQTVITLRDCSCMFVGWQRRIYWHIKYRDNASFMRTPASLCFVRGVLIYIHANEERKTHMNGGGTIQNSF